MQSSKRLYFIDALRAFAILMMLQGHFVSGLLDPVFKDNSNALYRFWLYCRGFTAPVFFTITGWVFTFLVLRSPVQGWKNPRLKKGVKRTFELLFWGYLLRLNLPMLLNGKLNNSFIQPDVLQIIGISLLFVMGIYLLFGQSKNVLTIVFLFFGTAIFMYEPAYVDLTFPSLPDAISGYLTKANKGVFYLFPWLGYVSIGAAIANVFQVKSTDLRPWAVAFISLGIALIFYSSSFLIILSDTTEIELFRKVAYNNFLFIRLGDVFVLFGFFMLLNRLWMNRIWTLIGTKTLSIYIVHYFILYGSLTGIGLYKYYNHSWSLMQSIGGAIGFILLTTLIVLTYNKYKNNLYTFLSEKVINLYIIITKFNQ